MEPVLKVRRAERTVWREVEYSERGVEEDKGKEGEGEQQGEEEKEENEKLDEHQGDVETQGTDEPRKTINQRFPLTNHPPTPLTPTSPSPPPAFLQHRSDVIRLNSVASSAPTSDLESETPLPPSPVEETVMKRSMGGGMVVVGVVDGEGREVGKENEGVRFSKRVRAEKRR
ncbi:hypothetical protein BC829DRAFT_384929 [Chytridium lagenaria]|nr:hypothetical protein BC829DRAFT_384929 [Chytridium lagenaria]